MQRRFIKKVINRMEGHPVNILNDRAYVTDLNPLPVTGTMQFSSTSANLDAFGRLRISQPMTLFDSFYRYSENSKFNYYTNNGGSYSINSNAACVQLQVGAQVGSIVARESSRVFAYQPGKSLLIIQSFTFNTLVPGLRQRIGYYDSANGIYLQANNDTISFVRRSSVTGSLQETTVNRSNWNYDSLDGNGPSGVILDTTRTQILFIDVEWLGVGTVRAGFVIDGQYRLCHRFNHANISAGSAGVDTTLPYMTTACLPLRAEIENTGGASVSGSRMNVICSSVISEGGYELRGRQRSVGWSILDSQFTLATKNTLYPVVSIRLKTTRLGAIVILQNVSLVSITGSTYRWAIISGASISGGGAWISAADDSSVEYKIDATSTITDGIILRQGLFNASGPYSPDITLDSSVFRYQLERNTFTNTCVALTLAVSSDNANNKVIATMDFEELT